MIEEEKKKLFIVSAVMQTLSLFISLDELLVIDTESDLDTSEEDVEKDSGQQISDCESSDEKPKYFPLKPSNVSELYGF